jgi:hypothetical protein
MVAARYGFYKVCCSSPLAEFGSKVGIFALKNLIYI